MTEELKELNATLVELAKERNKLATIKSDIEIAFSDIKKTMIGAGYAENLALRTSQNKKVTWLVEKAKMLALAAFDGKNKTINHDVDITESKEVVIRIHDHAVVWAVAISPSLLSIDRKIFDKIVLALPYEMLPPCVNVRDINGVRIGSNLDHLLEQVSE